MMIITLKRLILNVRFIPAWIAIACALFSSFYVYEFAEFPNVTKMQLPKIEAQIRNWDCDTSKKIVVQLYRERYGHEETLLYLLISISLFAILMSYSVVSLVLKINHLQAEIKENNSKENNSKK